MTQHAAMSKQRSRGLQDEKSPWGASIAESAVFLHSFAVQFVSHGIDTSFAQELEGRADCKVAEGFRGLQAQFAHGVAAFRRTAT